MKGLIDLVGWPTAVSLRT